ncbi:MAG: aldo/keto reductase [Bacteroidales bacterium]|nr:aldo/keto reductase [Bacteroidales bacterium]
MDKLISRREALKTMGLAGAALAAAGTVLESCDSSSKKVASPVKEAPEGTKVVTRTWDSLGETISCLGLGCMRFPTLSSQGGGFGHAAPLDQAQINQKVKYALDHGINYFDTAPAYGESEKAVGIAFKESGYPRESYLIATKMSNMAFGPSANPTLEAAKAMFEKSLESLQTDYVDFLLLHNVADDAAYTMRFISNGVLDYLIQMKEEGKIRHLGFSFHGSNEAFPVLLDKYNWEFVQIQLNYADWKDMPSGFGPSTGAKTDSETLYKILESRGIPAVIMEPIKGGALANVSDAIKARLAGRFPHLSPAGCALSFVASLPDVMVTLSGMSNMEQLKENIALFTDFKAFTQADHDFMVESGELYKSNTHIPCTGCEYCMPCPNGVNIPGNFKVYNTTSDELNIPDPENQGKDYKKKRKILLTRYRKDLKDGSRADACTKCNVCLEKCPQHIRIPNELQTIKDLIESLG